MQNDLVSVIMPSYNSVDYIYQSIESVIKQTYPHWELLITDDCSTDNTVEIVKQYAQKDNRIKLFILKENSGVAVARNNSIKKAQGRYIAMLDSDDLWLPEKLEKQLAFMQKNGYEFCYSSYIMCDDNGEYDGIFFCRKQESFQSIKKDDKIGCLTVIYDTKRLGKIYMPLLRKRQDWGFKILLLQKCKRAYGIKEPLAIYRIRNNSLSRQKIRLLKYNINVYKEVLGWSSIKAYCYFLFIFMPTYIKKKLLTKIISKFMLHSL